MQEMMAGLPPTLARTQPSVMYSYSFQIVLLLDPSGRAEDPVEFQVCQKNKLHNLKSWKEPEKLIQSPFPLME